MPRFRDIRETLDELGARRSSTLDILNGLEHAMPAWADIAIQAGLPKVEVAHRLRVSRPTLDAMLKRHALSKGEN